MARKLLAFVVCIIMLCGVSQTALAADSTVASTLRLEKADGTVTILNKNGKTVTTREGAKLYHGYTITTGAASYVHISLDNTKIVKLDASSSIEVRQSGKNLEVYLISGSLFFNVTAPVAADASLNIRTSTMVTGIRGTSGYMRVLSSRQTSFTLLEGVVTIWTMDKDSNLIKSYVLSAGQKAIGTRIITSTNQAHEDIEIFNYSEEEISGYVAVEIKDSDPLQDKIAEQSGLDVPSIVDNADEKLAQDEHDAFLREEEAQKLIDELITEGVIVDELFGKKPPTGGVGSGSGGSPVVTVPPINPAPPTSNKPPTNIISTAVDCATLNLYLYYYDTVIIDTTGSVVVNNGETVNISPTNTLIVRGSLQVNGGGRIINNGRMVMG